MIDRPIFQYPRALGKLLSTHQNVPVFWSKPLGAKLWFTGVVAASAMVINEAIDVSCQLKEDP